jgi:hypothetical protein
VHVRALLRSRRGSRLIGIFVPLDAGLGSIRLDHQLASTRLVGKHQTTTFLGASENGVEVELELAKAASILIWDGTAGLPSGADRLLATRPSSAVPSQLGDITLASRSVQLPPRNTSQ